MTRPLTGILWTRKRKTPNHNDKRLVDTSILRPLLGGTRAYRQYLEAELRGCALYVSPYVLMEYKRGHLATLMEIYFLLLETDTLSTLSDLLKVYSHRFESRKLKSALCLAGDLLGSHSLNLSKPRDKKAALLLIASYIRRLWLKARRQFIDNGQNGAHCAMAAVQPSFPHQNPGQGLHRFLAEMDDAKERRSGCRLHTFLTIKRRADVEAMIVASRQNEADEGATRVADTLEKIRKDGPRVCTCTTCSKVGDAIIVLERQRGMPIEHSDRSFNTLCPAVHVPHTCRPNERNWHQMNSDKGHASASPDEGRATEHA